MHNGTKVFFKSQTKFYIMRTFIKIPNISFRCIGWWLKTNTYFCFDFVVEIQNEKMSSFFSNCNIMAPRLCSLMLAVFGPNTCCNYFSHGLMQENKYMLWLHKGFGPIFYCSAGQNCNTIITNILSLDFEGFFWQSYSHSWR